MEVSCIFPKWSTETSICFITSKILALVFSLSSFANFRLDFYSLRFDAFSAQRKWSGWDQVISASLISDPPVLAPISGASPWFYQSHLLLKFCGVWCVVTVFFGSDFRTIMCGFMMSVLFTGFMIWNQNFIYQHQTFKTEIFWLYFLGLFYEIKAFIFFSFAFFFYLQVGFVCRRIVGSHSDIGPTYFLQTKYWVQVWVPNRNLKIENYLKIEN